MTLPTDTTPTPPAPTTTPPPWRFKLLHDGGCPFCRVEIVWLGFWNRRGRLAFEDITDPGFDPGEYGVTREALMRQMHGVFPASAAGPEERLVRGMAVFREAYRLVGIGFLLAPTGWPLLRPICDGLYLFFARYRLRAGRLMGRSCDVCGSAAADKE